MAAKRRFRDWFNHPGPGDLDRQLSLERFWDSEMSPYHDEHANLLAMFRDSGPASMDWDSRFNAPKPHSTVELSIAAFIGNRQYTNLLTARLLQQDRLVDSHGELLASIELVLNLISERGD